MSERGEEREKNKIKSEAVLSYRSIDIFTRIIV
jgi:hypothetical protein